MCKRVAKRLEDIPKYTEQEYAERKLERAKRALTGRHVQQLSKVKARSAFVAML